MKPSRIVVAVGLVGCAGATPKPRAPIAGPLSAAADERMIEIPAGKYVAGSTREERLAAYDDHHGSTGTDAAREGAWFEREEDRHVATLPAFTIDLMPVTTAQFAEYVATGKVPAPPTWVDGRPPHEREDHPVVQVTWLEASGYCAWRGRRLPTAVEYEKAARGTDGFTYPWGNAFEAGKLNSFGGANDTMTAGSFPGGASPYGVLDLAGNVLHWTATRAPDGKATVKGSSFEDHPGLGRGAAGQSRPVETRAATIGFRCVGAR